MTNENKPATVKHKAVVVKIDRLYRGDMRELELYETARAAWRVGKDREKAEYAIAVFRGVAKEVYLIRKWHPVGTLKYKIRNISKWKADKRRWEFDGRVADKAIRQLYVGREIYIGGKAVTGSRAPVRYANIKGARK